MARIPITVRVADEERWFPPGYQFAVTNVRRPSRRERAVVGIVSWIVACILHVVAFYAIGWYIEYRFYTDVEIGIDWGDEPLTGFGMMDVYDDSGSDAGYEPPPAVEPEVDPFVEEKPAETKPDLDPDSIVIPEPDPDPAVVVDAAPTEPAKPDYDLRKHPEKLKAVRRDVESMPDLHVLAPGNAKLIVLIRNDRLVGSRFENSVRRLFRSFPDYRFALGASEIDPVRDIDAMLIATSNPEYYADTFLVVAHHIPEDNLKRYVSNSFPTKIDWQEHNGRPIAVPDSNDGKYNPRSGIYRRSIYLPDDHTVLFLRPEVLPTLDVAHVDAVVQERDDQMDGGQPSAVQTFLQSLAGVSSFDSESMPSLFLMVQGIERLNLGSRFPKFDPPYAVSGSLSTADNPHLNLVAIYPTEGQAEQLVSVWPEIVDAASSISIPGVAGLAQALSVANDGNRVFITGDLNGTMISLILMFASRHLESNG